MLIHASPHSWRTYRVLSRFRIAILWGHRFELDKSWFRFFFLISRNERIESFPEAAHKIRRLLHLGIECVQHTHVFVIQLLYDRHESNENTSYYQECQTTPVETCPDSYLTSGNASNFYWIYTNSIQDRTNPHITYLFSLLFLLCYLWLLLIRKCMPKIGFNRPIQVVSTPSYRFVLSQYCGVWSDENCNK